MRIVIREAREPGAVEVMADHVLDGPPRHVAHAQAVGRVLPHRHPGEDRVALKHHRVLRAVGAGRQVDLDRSGGGGFQPGEDAQQRRLAAPGGADDSEELAARDVERDIVDGDQAAEGLDEIADADRRARRGAGAFHRAEIHGTLRHLRLLRDLYGCLRRYCREIFTATTTTTMSRLAHGAPPLPACGERVGVRGRLPDSERSDSRRRPLTRDYSFRHAAHTFSGVAGMSIWAAPGTASAIAFITAASAAVVPASPAPLTPSGLVVAGTTMSPIVN